MGLLAITQLPFFSYIHSSEDIVFYMYIVARVTGVFLTTPILGNANVPKTVRAFLVFMVAALFAMTMYDMYRGENSIYTLASIPEEGGWSLFLLAFDMLKEVAIGALIGFSFVLFLEGLAFAGQLTSFMMGFAMSRIIDPVSGASQTVLGQLFIMLGTLFILSLDLHHIFFNILGESFYLAPLGNYHLPYEMLSDVIQGSGRLWTYALQFSAIPYVILFLVTVGLGFMAKIMPEMNIFMVGFPLKIFIGYYCVIVAVGFFPQTIKHAFVEFGNLSRIMLVHIGSG
jgi:flagellar biosynthesis protein FliR